MIPPTGTGDGQREILLAVAGATKSFGSNRALRGVDLRVRAGELHGLVGENGSGKSTLIKILAGYHAPDEPTRIEVGGAELRLPVRPAEAYERGLRFVHQDLGLVDSMTVTENVAAGHYGVGRLGRIGWARQRERTRTELERFGVAAEPDALVGTLAGAERAMIALLRSARSGDDDAAIGGKVFVLDEPTTYLARNDVDRLFAFLRRIVAEGSGVILVTHQLSEVLELCETVSVLRDGALVVTRPTAGLAADDIVELMVGRRVERSADTGPPPAGGSARLEVRALAGESVRDVSFAVGPGEIVGITGLAGMGHEEIPYLLFGARPRRGGTILIDGAEHDVSSPRAAMRLGMALVPGDRGREGIVREASVAENVTLPVIRRLARHGRLSASAERALVGSLLERFLVVPPEPGLRIGALSGGNQQKAVIGKWLNTEPRILLLHQPSQGVDVASREAIFGFVRQSAAEGTSVLICSNDHEELARLCERVLVMRDGAVGSTLRRPDITAEAVGWASHSLAAGASAA